MEDYTFESEEYTQSMLWAIFVIGMLIGAQIALVIGIFIGVVITLVSRKRLDGDKYDIPPTTSSIIEHDIHNKDEYPTKITEKIKDITADSKEVIKALASGHI